MKSWIFFDVGWIVTFLITSSWPTSTIKQTSILGPLGAV